MTKVANTSANSVETVNSNNMNTEKTATVAETEKTAKAEKTEKTVKTVKTAKAPKEPKAETPVNPNEKSYRVIFRKNNGQGKRTRVVMKAESVEALMEAIAEKAKADRMRPMRVQEMNGTTVASKFRIKAAEGELDLVKAKARKVAELTDAVEADEKTIEKKETKKAPAKAKAPAAKKVEPKVEPKAEATTEPETEDAGLEFEV